MAPAFESPEPPLATGGTPVAVGARVAVLDALRGFALFGVLIANTQHFAGTTGAPDTGAAWHFPAADRLARFIVDGAFDGKFYSIFALLFGIGCGMQWARCSKSLRLARRRLLGLLGLGFAHLCLLWYGDILALYALLGLVLLQLLDCPPRTLLRTSLILFALPVLLHAIFLVAIPARVDGAEPGALRFATERAVAQGGYLGRLQWNVVHGLAQRGYDLVGTGRPFKVLATFMIGLYAYRTGLLQTSDSTRQRLRRFLRVGLLLGLPLNLGLALMMQTSLYERLQPMGLLQPVFYAYGVPALALAYASGFALAFENPWFARWTSRTLGSVGRLSLTNYIMQSVVGVVIYDRFGGGLFGQFGTLTSLALGSVIFVFQIAFSMTWIRCFGQGPLEWLWRSFTYGRTAAELATPELRVAEGWAKR